MRTLGEVLALQDDLDAHSALKVQTAPTVEPITKEEAKTHLRILTEDPDYTEQDTYIEGLIKTARIACEAIQGRSYITQTLDFHLDAFPKSRLILVPRPPLQSVGSIVYTLEDATTGTVDSGDYVVDTVSTPGRILLKEGEDWPSDALQVGPSVRIRFNAGYGAAGSSVPSNALRAMYLLIGHWFGMREAVIDMGRRDLLPIPLGVESLLWLDRNFF